ncbi:MAG: hypothetical protein HYR94_10730 [Chloroflexi bacterium]|nr:hypothetical protein [Chloroflexota bacterium]
MAYYLVKAKAKTDQMAELKDRLDDGEILTLRPFGRALSTSLQDARLDPQGWAVWEEEDYCHPPLAMERAAVLDAYFTDLSVEKVEQGAGWQRIDALPSLWVECVSQSANSL